MTRAVARRIRCWTLLGTARSAASILSGVTRPPRPDPAQALFEQRVDGRDEHERDERRRQQAADDDAGQRCLQFAALSEAAALCDNPDFRPELCNLLARREYMNVPTRVIQASLVGPFDSGHGNFVPATDFIRYHRNGANDPTAAKAAWLIEGFTRHRFLPAGMTVPADLGARTFRADLYNLVQKPSRTTRHDKALVHA